jgi:gliding motility-associated-like protein
MKKYIIILFLTIVSFQGYSQSIVCKQIHYSTDDANVRILTPDDPPGTYLLATIWTWQGSPGIVRAYTKFDLSNIFSTTNTLMNTANLYLYNPYTSDLNRRHEYFSTTLPNQVEFHRVISYWDENIITWNNQPLFDNSLSVTSPVFCTQPHQRCYDDLVLNVDAIILNNRMLVSDYNGFMMRLVQEDINNRYRAVAFEGHHYHDSTYWPQLEVEYEFYTIPRIDYLGYNRFEVKEVSDIELIFDNIVYKWTINNNIYYGKIVQPICADTFDVSLEMTLVNRLKDSCHYYIGDTVCMNTQPCTFPSIICTQVHFPTTEGCISTVDSNALSVYSYLQAANWVWGTTPGVMRSYLDFDLSDIFTTTNTVMNKADLCLFNPYTSDPDIKHEYQYTNLPVQLLFHRVTSNWHNITLTWNNQPSFDNQSITSPSFCMQSNPDYEDLRLNVDALILQNKMLLSDFNGFMFRMIQEDANNIYRQVSFEGVRYHDIAFRPRLEVEYEFLTKPAVNYYGDNTFEVLNVSDIELIFDDIVYKWIINNNTYYGKIVQPVCEDKFDVSLEMILVNRLQDSCHYHVWDTVCKALTTKITLNLKDTIGRCDSAITVSADYPYANYLWNTGERTESIRVRASGTYWVEVSNQSCFTRDTVVVLLDAIRLDLPDTAVLCGTYVSLNAGYSKSEHPYVTYKWDVGETTEVLRVSSTGVYYIEVSDNGCTVRDSIIVINFTGLDMKDTVIMCDGEVTLYTNYPSADSYLWSTGAKTPDITVTRPGTYWAQITRGQCSSKDATTVIAPDPLSLEDTLVICGGSVKIESNYPEADYLWNTGDTTENITVNTPGVYSVEIFTKGCVLRDSVLILEVTLEVDQDLIFCGSPIEIKAYCSNPDYYLWNTGETIESIIVDTLGTYWVEIKKMGCVLKRSTNVSLPPVLQLGDTLIMCEDPVEIIPNLTGDRYMWSTGQTTQSIMVSNQGSYWLELIYRGCILRDTVEVIEKNIADFEINTTGDLCQDDILELSVNLNDGFDYVWSTGESSSNIFITMGGIFSVEIFNGSCSNSASITVACPCDLWLPNTFTPNGDKLNEVFLPVFSSPVSNFSMHIFDRWGSLIYKTTELIPWDGTLNGELLAAGVYSCTIRYSCLYEPNKVITKYGRITLVR